MIPVAWIKLIESCFKVKQQAGGGPKLGSSAECQLFETAPRSTKCMHYPGVPGRTAAMSQG